jgi:hypothetical protein
MHSRNADNGNKFPPSKIMFKWLLRNCNYIWIRKRSAETTDKLKTCTNNILYSIILDEYVNNTYKTQN